MRKQTWAVLAVLALAGAPASALQPGDLVVAVDIRSLVGVDRRSGEVEHLGGFSALVTGIAIDANGGIFLTGSQRSLPDDPRPGDLWHRDSKTGVWRRLADLERAERGIAIDPDGVLLIPGPTGVARVDPQTGQRRGFVEFDPPLGGQPFDIAVEETGEILLSVIDLSGTASPRIVRVDPDTGAWEGIGISPLAGIAVEAHGSILGTRPGKLLRLDPETGVAAVVTMDGFLSIPLSVAIEPDGQIVVSDDSTLLGGDAVVVRVDPDDGTQSLVVSGFRAIGAIAVVPPDVEIDIRPSHLSAGTGSRRMLPVVLFGSDLVEVEDVDVESLAFGPEGAAPVRSRVVGRGRDAFPDLLLFFRAEEAGLAPGDAEACLEGRVGVFDFEACDDVVVRGAPRAPHARGRGLAGRELERPLHQGHGR